MGSVLSPSGSDPWGLRRGWWLQGGLGEQSSIFNRRKDVGQSLCREIRGLYIWEQTPCTKGCTTCPIMSTQELPHVSVRNLNSCLDASAAPQGDGVLRLDQATQQARPQVFTKNLTQEWKSHLAQGCGVRLLVGG